MFIVQPSIRFGEVIAAQLAGRGPGAHRWSTFEFAVAWVRARGIGGISAAARAFLAAGGSIRAIVGLDFGGTSQEGLAMLLDLELPGADITTHVFFDPNGYTFHPKVYLFRDNERARLYVGSHNMTGGGLENNVEAALGISGHLEDEAIRAARSTFAAWRDTHADPRTQRLTPDLLAALVRGGLVRTEAVIREQQASEPNAGFSEVAAIFGQGTTRPQASQGFVDGGHDERVAIASSGVEEVLLMRVRKRRNGNQVQISQRVLDGPFMNGTTEVLLADGSRRAIGSNTARGSRNTERFEAPGLRAMTNPVARFRWVSSTEGPGEGGLSLLLELFDADQGGVGADIFTRLEQGIGTPPLRDLTRLSHEETGLSSRKRESAQWYRLDVIRPTRTAH